MSDRLFNFYHIGHVYVIVKFLVGVCNGKSIFEEIKYFLVDFNKELLFDSLNDLGEEVIEVPEYDLGDIGCGFLLCDCWNDDLIVGVEHGLKD